METTLSPSSILWATFSIGFVFGLIGQKTHFCTMGAISDIVNMDDWTRMRMWLLAIGIAILGAASLHSTGLIDLDKSIYRTPTLTWLSYLVGGFCFGVGMVLASGCGSKTLMRIGGGNLKSLVVFLTLGIVAYMTMRGILAVFRVSTLDTVRLQLGHNQDFPAFLSAWGMPPATALWLCAGLLGGGLILFALKGRDFLNFDNLLGGLGSGLAIVAAWYVSGHLGYLAEDPETLQEAFLVTNSGRMESLTFVAPQAYTLELLMLWSDSSRKMSFGIATALGVITGAGAWAWLSRSFRWEGFRDTEDLVRHLLGAALMGFGGVTAMGCTVGQGITGLSTLALGSLITLLAIALGGWAMLKYQYWRLMQE